ncbi:MBL fold metallo-hydrolase [Ferrimonas sediminicola]|uniref:MBL fold metallo-hydrolase n=1 Tax=Ferrimonas sediminicola TaxID=2569538 RepID=A0A4U1BBD0_9GAMM|nr:MBL fold metallo-hydrolase [Ferrimonas sediminicola]TKB48247.1 MBL fold metallo-hydrolase [Ferrimonas sediminicola]
MKYQVVPVSAYRTNCALLWCTQSNRAALIDPGGDPELLMQAIEAQGVTLERILLTHGHIDHVGAAMVLADRLGVPVEGPHRDDQFLLEMLPEEARTYGFPMVEAFTPGRYLEEGDRIQVGNLTLEVLHTPGHTPGHLVFHNPQAGIAFVGDLIFAGSVGRTDFEGGNRRDLLHSITTKLWPLGADTEFVPGHGPNSTIARERRLNPYVADNLLQG